LCQSIVSPYSAKLPTGYVAYSRKVCLFARESNLDSQIEEIIVNPFADDKDDLIKANSLGKIPTLVLNNGKALYDSPVIFLVPKLSFGNAIGNSISRGFLMSIS
jgi:hypothetical protein